MVTTNLLASSTEGGQFSSPRTGRDRRPRQPEWRAVSHDRARRPRRRRPAPADQTVDVFVTASVNVLTELGRRRAARLLHRQVDQDHLPGHADPGQGRARSTSSRRRSTSPRRSRTSQASGAATFSLALRPDADTRQVDASKLGTTTNEVIIRYGLPIPVVYPPAAARCRHRAPTPPRRPSRPTPTRHRRPPRPARRPVTASAGPRAAGIHLRAADPARLPAVRAAFGGPGGR